MVQQPQRGWVCFFFCFLCYFFYSNLPSLSSYLLSRLFGLLLCASCLFLCRCLALTALFASPNLWPFDGVFLPDESRTSRWWLVIQEVQRLVTGVVLPGVPCFLIWIWRRIYLYLFVTITIYYKYRFWFSRWDRMNTNHRTSLMSDQNQPMVMRHGVVHFFNWNSPKKKSLFRKDCQIKEIKAVAAKENSFPRPQSRRHWFWNSVLSCLVSLQEAWNRL